jgi:putative aldouronate transport system permease protein
LELTKKQRPLKSSAKERKAAKAEAVARVTWGKSLRNYWQLYLMLIPVVAYFVIFKFLPMYGVQIAFRNFSPVLGFWKSEWVGLQYFKQFFNSFSFEVVLTNTLTLSIYLLVVSFPAPIILALLLNEIQNRHFKKALQTITYAPHFLSMVVMISMLLVFVDVDNGIINTIITMFGGEPKDFISDPKWFRHLYVISDIWKGAGWGSIIYLSSLSSISPQLYEAARIDGASRFKQLWCITLPSIAPTIVLMLIMDCGRIMNVGFEKVLLMQNYLNLDASEVISTYVYKIGIGQMQFSYSTAIDLFNSVINLIMLLTVNAISKRFSESSLF